MKPFQESMRYEYDLTPYSVVFDCGFYKGDFSRLLLEKTQCRIFAFEPVREFYLAAKPLAIKLGVDLMNVAVGARGRKEEFGVKGDMSGLFTEPNSKEVVYYMGIEELHDLLEVKEVDLLKLNIESGEFELLEHVLERNTATRYRNIQVQPHGGVPDAEKRWSAIQAGLLKTHHLTFDAPWCWQNYELNA